MKQPSYIVSLYDGPVYNASHYQGCGVCINDQWILTAGHVAAKLLENGTSFAGNIPNRGGGLSINKIFVHSERDLAVLKLVETHDKDLAVCDFESKLSAESNLSLVAWNKTENCVRGPESAEVLNFVEPGSYEISKLPVPGMSGGAMLLRNKLVGIIQAKDENELTGIVIPLTAAREFLAPYMPEQNKPSSGIGKSTHQGGGNFKETIRKKIIQELRNEKIRPLLAGLKQELELSAADVDQASFQVAGQLLQMEADEAIRNYLMPATVGCTKGAGGVDLLKSGKDLIKKGADEILGWLVLGSVDEDEIPKLMQSRLDDGNLYFVFGQNTLAGVEVVVSRSFQHKAELTRQSVSGGLDVLCGQGCIRLASELFNENDTEVVRRLELEIWNKVFNDPFSQKKPEEKLTGIDQANSEIGLLNATLKNRRKMKNSTKHYYIAFTINELPRDRAVDIYRILLAKDRLCEMTIVEFGTSNGSQAFVVNEFDLIAAINDFYQAVNRQDQKPIG